MPLAPDPSVMGAPETTWEEHQQAFVRRLQERPPGELETGTVVVVPSLSFAPTELAKITGAVRYEERLLYMLLFLGALNALARPAWYVTELFLKLADHV